MEFNHIEVESSNIKSIAYNKKYQVMEVIFNNGTKYQYKDVPEPIYIELLSSESKGRYFNMQIKPIYKFKKINR